MMSCDVYGALLPARTPPNEGMLIELYFKVQINTSPKDTQEETWGF